MGIVKTLYIEIICLVLVQVRFCEDMIKSSTTAKVWGENDSLTNLIHLKEQYYSIWRQMYQVVLVLPRMLGGNAQKRYVQREMNAYFLSNLPSIAESKFISAINTRIISYINGKMMITQTQDSVIGGYLLTKDEIKMDQIFVSRLHKNGRLTLNQMKFTDKEGFTSGKDCLSLNFPNLSFKENTKFYDKQLSKFIDYKESDQKLDIQLGRIKTGYFDKSGNNYQKVIALTFNPTTALNTIFSIQQTILNSNMYTGLSVGLKELLCVNQQKLNKLKDQMISKGYEIMQQYNNNLYGSQLDKSAYEEFQDKLRNCFQTDGLEHIMEASMIKGNKLGNNLVNLALSGSKGSFSNIKNMIIQIGQVTIDGEPIKPLFHNRINMFYKKNDINPLSKGIVMNSYLSGLTPSELLINSTSERIQMLTKTLSVAKPGYLGRKLIKNTENVIIANNRYVCKTNAIYQDLFGLDGFNVSCLSRFQIPMFYQTEEQFKTWFTETLPKSVDINNIVLGDKQITKEQFLNMTKKHVNDISDIIRETKKTLCRSQLINNINDISDHIQIPVTLQNIVETHIQQLVLENAKLSAENIVMNLQILREFCTNLKYLYFNRRMQLSKAYIADSYSHGMKNLKLALLTVFTFDKLAIFSGQQLHYLLESIGLLVKEAMISPGSAIGVSVAQAFQEYFTQDMLDAIHNVKGSAVQIDPLDRIIDIFNNRTPSDLLNLNKPQPTIKIPLKFKEGQTIEQQKQRAKEIANKLKVINLKNLINKWEIIMSNVERETEPQYIEDREMIESAQIPVEKSVWCFRIVLDKNKMFLNNIIVDEIKTSIESSHDMYVITRQTKDVSIFSDQKDLIVMRMYLGPSIQFNSGIELKNILEDFLDFNLRGIRGILDTIVKKETISTFDEHLKQIVKKDRLVIYTEGSNIRDIMRQQLKYKDDIDFNAITCDNHAIVMQFFGKSAAQQKIYNELKGVFGDAVDIRHISCVSSIMIQQGYLSIIESDGIRKRNKDAPLISMTESRSIINLVNSCVQNQVSNLQSLSDNTMIGQLSNNSGTNFNRVILNLKFIQDINKEKDQIFDI